MLIENPQSQEAVSQTQDTQSDERLQAVPTPTATDDDIARRAYSLYLGRNSEDGHDVEDWLQAERELRDGIPLKVQEADISNPPRSITDAT